MDTSLPTALIVGIENFGARQLAIELLNRGLNVIGVGDYVGGMNEYVNFENRIYLKDVEEIVGYVFDFEGNKESIDKARSDGAKLIVVEINNKRNELVGENIEARKIKIHGLYGQEMDKNSDSFTKFLIEATKAAVKNKNLIMPKKGTGIRLLSTSSGAELMIRIAMTPGLDGEMVEVWGRRNKK